MYVYRISCSHGVANKLSLRSDRYFDKLCIMWHRELRPSTEDCCPSSIVEGTRPALWKDTRDVQSNERAVVVFVQCCDLSKENYL